MGAGGGLGTEGVANGDHQLPGVMGASSSWGFIALVISSCLTNALPLVRSILLLAACPQPQHKMVAGRSIALSVSKASNIVAEGKSPPTPFWYQIGGRTRCRQAHAPQRSEMWQRVVLWIRSL